MFSTSGRDIPLRSSLLNIPLFVLSFLSLTLVLAWSSWQQYQQDKAMHINEVHLTLENYAQQAGLLAQAGIAANTMFVRGYADLIGKTAAGDPQASEHLWNEMQRSFFNITGYTLFDGEGHFLQQGGEQIHSNEIADIYVNINASGGDHGLFLLRYGGRGGFYFLLQ